MKTTSKDRSSEYLRTKDLIDNEFCKNNNEEDLNEDFYNLDLNVNTLKEEYDNYISELHRKLQIAREERKRSEMESKILQHRISLLHNQEKIAMQKFERTRNKIDQILDNRKFFNESNHRLNVIKKNKESNLNRLKENAKTIRDNLRSSHSAIRNKNLSKDSRILKQIKNGSIERKRLDKRAEIMRENEELIRKNNELIRKIQEEDRKREIAEKKSKLKEELLKKIQDDELERQKLENQLAKFEKEEMNIMKIFRNESEEEYFSKSFQMAYNYSMKKQNQSGLKLNKTDDEIVNNYAHNNTEVNDR